MELQFNESERKLFDTMSDNIKEFAGQYMIQLNPIFFLVIRHILSHLQETVVDNPESGRTLKASLSQLFESQSDNYDMFSFLCQCYFSIKVYGYTVDSDQHPAELISGNYFGINSQSQGCTFSFSQAGDSYHKLLALKESVSLAGQQPSTEEKQSALPSAGVA